MNHNPTPPAEVYLVRPSAESGSGMGAAVAGPEQRLAINGPSILKLDDQSLTHVRGWLVSTLELPAAAQAGLLLEPLTDGGGRRRLLLVNRHRNAVRINGEPAPLLARLQAGDELRCGSAPALRLGVTEPTPLGLAGECGVAGQPCLVCLSPLIPEDAIYQCPCGAAYHWNPSAGSRLQCGHTLSHCLRCEREMQVGGARAAVGVLSPIEQP